MYKQSTAIKGFGPAALDALANADNTSAMALILQHLLQAPAKTAEVTAYTDMVGNAVDINEQVSELVKAANKDVRIEALMK